MGNVAESFISLFALIVTVAIIAVLVSNRSNTANVIKSFGQAFSSSLGVAVSPVTGSGGGMPSLGAYTNF